MVHSPSSDFLSRTIGVEELDTESVDAGSYDVKPSSVVVDFLNNEQLLAEINKVLNVITVNLFIIKLLS